MDKGVEIRRIVNKKIVGIIPIEFFRKLIPIEHPTESAGKRIVNNAFQTVVCFSKAISPLCLLEFFVLNVF